MLVRVNITYFRVVYRNKRRCVTCHSYLSGFDNMWQACTPSQVKYSRARLGGNNVCCRLCFYLLDTKLKELHANSRGRSQYKIVYKAYRGETLPTWITVL
jgi:hypothetical protein